LLFPVGVLLITAMMLRAGYQCVKNGGIDWRGTHYPLDQLRTGQRVKFLNPTIVKIANRVGLIDKGPNQGQRTISSLADRH
jgi:hypothetical protein